MNECLKSKCITYPMTCFFPRTRLLRRRKNFPKKHPRRREKTTRTKTRKRRRRRKKRRKREEMNLPRKTSYKSRT